MSDNKVTGIITKIEGQSVFLNGEEYILLANPFKFVNKLRIGSNVELSLNEDKDIQFFKVLEQIIRGQCEDIGVDVLALEVLPECSRPWN